MSQILYFTGCDDLQVVGDTSLAQAEYYKLFDAARKFILKCYNLVNCKTLHEARVVAWEKKMRNNSLIPPKLCAVPPTEMAFRENVLRAHLAAAVMKNSLSPDPPPLIVIEHAS